MCWTAHFAQRVRMATAVAVVLLAGAGLTPPAVAGTVFVSTSGNDENDGLTWATAKQTVRAGLNAAAGGDEVWVAAGTYVESIRLKDAVALYGGFAGGETDLSQRDWATNKTILDGNQARSVMTSPSGATETTRIDGFTIRNGKAYSGGGIYCSSSSPTIANNTITGNVGSAAAGGIYCYFSSPMIVNNTITDNHVSGTPSRGGGGIWCYSSSPTILNNTISGNTGFSGGGIYCTDSSFPMIANNTITGNTANGSSHGLGGGVYCVGCSPTITDNAITSNSAYDGGGICCSSSSPTITNNAITSNSAYDGGGIYCSSSSPTITNNTISSNTTSAGGSGIFCSASCPIITGNAITANILASSVSDVYGGAIYCGNASGPKIANNTIEGNTTSTSGFEAYGGAIYCANYSSPTIMDNVIAANTIAAAGSQAYACGGGIYCDSSSPAITNNTITKNTVSASGATPGLIARGGGIYCTNTSLPVITNNTIAGNTASAPTDGSIAYGDGIGCYNSAPIIEGNTISANSDCGIRCNSASATITNNTISGNSDSGITCTSCSPLILRNIITANSSRYDGGGIYLDGSSPTIANNTITGNIASQSGGGIFCYMGSPTITNNTIAGNDAYAGGGIYCLSRPTITNTIVAFNSSGIYVDGMSMPVLRHNCVFGNPAGNYLQISDPTGTDGNISVDPKLADLGYANAHIQPDSPCVEAGDDADVQPDWLDVDAQPRIAGSHVDMGADESDGTVWPAGPYVIVRVSPTGDDANDGFSWALAKRTVQAGIDAAASLGGEVWVQTGTYNECITLRPLANVYGGFAGAETARDSRDWTANLTVLDGQQGGSVVTARSVGRDLSRIDGFTIRNGSGTLLGSSRYGGGIYIEGSSLTIANNTIAQNSVTGSSEISVYGGGICCIHSSPTIMDSVITGNSAAGSSVVGRGGGVYCYYSSPTIFNNTIKDNAAQSLGGGVYCDLLFPVIANNRIVGNVAVSGGGICCFRVTSEIYCVPFSPTMVGNTIVANRAWLYGGGVYSCLSSPSIVNNTIVANTAPGSGGIYSSRSPVTITNTIVAFNSSGIYPDYSGNSALLFNCVFGNTDYNYSGVVDPTGTNGNISADPLFLRPAGPGPDGQWGTQDDDYGDLRLSNGSPCIDAGDNAAVPADTLDLDGDGDTTEPLPFDLLGGLRFFDDPFTIDTGLGTPPIVDMGAYEHVPVPAALESSIPANGRSLWRNRRNIIRLTFDADIAAPDAGAVMIQEMLAGGAYSDDLSAGFTFTVENDGQGKPRVLKIRENASTLQHRKWYAVRNTGAWTGVAPFTVQYVVQVGDANNDSRVLNTDFGWVNAAIPTFSTADDDRRDINGDGRILNTDFGVLNAHIPSFPVAKPAGH